jgi:hypothetical protein
MQRREREADTFYRSLAPAAPAPAAGRDRGRNAAWRDLNTHDVISMPDPWEHPWFAA